MFATPSERKAPPLPKGCRPLVLPCTHFELEVDEDEGGARYEEIALWGLSGSFAMKPKIELSACGWFVHVEYDSKRFLDPDFLAGNPHDHGHLYPVIIYRYKKMVREMTCNFTEFPRYVVHIPLRTAKGREIVFKGLHYKKLSFRYGRGRERERENFDVQRIFVKADWDDVTRKKESKTGEFRFDTDESDEDGDEDYGPNDYRHAPFRHTTPGHFTGSNQSRGRTRDADAMSLVSSDSKKKPRNHHHHHHHGYKTEEGYPTVPVPPAVDVVPMACIQKPPSPVQVTSYLRPVPPPFQGGAQRYGGCG